MLNHVQLDAHVRESFRYAMNNDPNPQGPPTELGELLAEIRNSVCPGCGGLDMHGAGCDTIERNGAN